MEKNIQLLKIGEKARISRIDGPSLRQRVAGIGIKERVIVERLALAPLSGCIEIKIGRRRVTLGLGVSMKLRVDQGGTITGLVEMNPGDRAVISQIHGGQTIVEILKRHFGIDTGSVIEMAGQKPDRDFLVEIAGMQSSICEGDASKILVTKRRRTQLNTLRAGDEAPIVAIAAGSRARSMLKEFGIEEGRVIRIVKITQSEYKQPEVPLRIRAGDQEVSIGYGMAEKIWVEDD